MVAAPEVVPLVELSNVLAQVVDKVVNCALVYVPLPPEQVALTCQSYKVPAVKLPMLTEVEEIPEARLSHVDDEAAL
jgi:hypothetical protein